MAWHWPLVASTHIPLAQTGHMSKPNVTTVEKYILPALLPEDHKMGESRELRTVHYHLPSNKAQNLLYAFGENLEACLLVPEFHLSPEYCPPFRFMAESDNCPHHASVVLFSDRTPQIFCS